MHKAKTLPALKSQSKRSNWEMLKEISRKGVCGSTPYGCLLNWLRQVSPHRQRGTAEWVGLDSWWIRNKIGSSVLTADAGKGDRKNPGWLLEPRVGCSRPSYRNTNAAGLVNGAHLTWEKNKYGELRIKEERHFKEFLVWWELPFKNVQRGGFPGIIFQYFFQAFCVSLLPAINRC